MSSGLCMFASREAAGKLLAEKLREVQVTADMVFGIARGGVVIAQEIAQAFHLPLEVLVIKKLGAPSNPELAIGALALDSVTYIDENFARAVGADNAFIKSEVLRKHAELKKREQMFRSGKMALNPEKKRVILADDGVATGATVMAACMWLRQKKVQQIILALPVVSQETVKKLRSQVDKCVTLEEPVDLRAVGEFYKDFREVTDEEVINILASRN